MNAIIQAPLRGEIIEPGQGITLVLALHPLTLDYETIVAPAGLTILDLVDLGKARGTTRLKSRVVASIEGHLILEAYWSRIRPKPGTTVLLRAVAEFGGDNSLLRTLLTIAVIGASLFLAPVLAPIIGLSAGLIGAAITVGGQLLINALFPISQSQLANNNASQTYSISGGQNSADPFGVIPSVLGKNRVYPKLGARTYTETIGADQYLRMLFVWGYGPLDVSALKIGETLLSAFADVQVETRQGYLTDTAVTLYPNEVIQLDLSVVLTAAAGWQVRTTATAVDEISLDVVAPGGVVLVDSSGTSQNYTVSIRAEYSPTGAGTWALLGTLDLTARSTDAIRTGLRIHVANGQYDVRVMKTSTDYTGAAHVQEQTIWSALRSFRNTPPISFSKPLAITALRIRATSQLNGTIDQLNGICQSKVVSWNGSTWVADTISNNPADLFRAVLQGQANAKPQPDSKVDLVTLGVWGAYCTANGFTFDMVRDFAASVYDTLSAIAMAGRAAVIFRDGQWSVVWDDPNAPIVQHFTPRNSKGFSGTRSYPTTPHAFRARFVNQAIGYVQDERIVYDDGYTAANATLFEQIEFPGQTNPNNVWRHGRFHIAQARLRPEIYTLNVDIEHIVATRGDRVRVTHDVPEWGLASGRVKSVAGQVLTLDEPVNMVTGTAYTIRFRLADGSSLLRNVVENDGQNFVITLAPGDANQSVPGAGDLFLFGQINAESVVLRIRSITPGDHLTAKVTLVDDAPAISSADTGAIPAFNSQITVPPDPFTAAPVNLSIREAFAGVAGETANGVYLIWETVAGEYPTGFETQDRDDGGDGLWKDGQTILPPTKTAFFANRLTGSWSYRVRAVFASGTFSNWAELTGQVLIGIGSIPLSDVNNLRMTYVDNTSALTWDEVIDFRPIRYEIRKGDTWQSALVIGDQAHPPFVTFGDANYWVAAVTRPLPGVTTYSTHPVTLAVAGSVLVDNVIASHDEPGTGWSGGISGPGIIASGLFETTAANVLAYYEVPASHVFDTGFARPTRLNATWKARGVPVAQNELADSNILINPDVLAAASARFIDSWVEVATSQTGSSDVFAPSDVFAAPDVFSGTIAFGAWTKFAPGVYVGRFFKFRLVLISNDPSIIAAAVSFTVTADVPDRVDHVTNHALAAGGETFTFSPDGSLTAVPFIGGPGSATVPAVQVTWNESAGDQLSITGLTLAQVTIQILNGGVGVARTITAFFQGW